MTEISPNTICLKCGGLMDLDEVATHIADEHPYDAEPEGVTWPDQPVRWPWDDYDGRSRASADRWVDGTGI